MARRLGLPLGSLRLEKVLLKSWYAIFVSGENLSDRVKEVIHDGNVIRIIVKHPVSGQCVNPMNLQKQLRLKLKLNSKM